MMTGGIFRSASAPRPPRWFGRVEVRYISRRTSDGLSTSWERRIANEIEAKRERDRSRADRPRSVNSERHVRPSDRRSTLRARQQPAETRSRATSWSGAAKNSVIPSVDRDLALLASVRIAVEALDSHGLGSVALSVGCRFRQRLRLRATSNSRPAVVSGEGGRTNCVV